MTRFILVGAEGFSELGDLPRDDLPGIREATKDEEIAFKQGLEPLAKEKGITVGDFFCDGTGRPYWLIAVEDNAPEKTRTKAEKYKKCLRLFD